MSVFPCAGTLPRRAFLRASLTGLSALGISDLMRLQGQGAAAGSGGGPSMIVVWLWGGPSHMETFDLKPDAPEQYRGLFKPIPTNVPGMEICEKLPRLARTADKFALIRSIGHGSPGHVNSTHTVLTGYPGELVETPPFAPKYPYIFNAAQKILPERRPGMPQWVALPDMRYEGGGGLGRSHGPFRVKADPNSPEFRVPELVLDAGDATASTAEAGCSRRSTKCAGDGRPGLDRGVRRLSAAGPRRLDRVRPPTRLSTWAARTRSSATATAAT